ncbi:hypothetical protein QTI66_33070 [Variovorax sp. J22R133]|uniref:hypothetical protein n=1 Tax=Variovorax brevis TaxID=3053503 RepID=UPI002575D582|nr:hypothetical protein [Variovorax sp. J22R133]MDM0116959.1 hypothetical protein [Variovorax sp. J22R133]
MAALANSLAAAKYAGVLWAGYRGDLADWVAKSPFFDAASGRLGINDVFSVCFVKLETPMFFAYYKPAFMLSVLEDLDPDCDTVAYMDPDIVVKCGWANIGCWFSGGLGVIEDVNGSLPSRHPKRLMWTDWFGKRGVHVSRDMVHYYNSGFISVPREYANFLALWRKLCEHVLEYNAGLKSIKSGHAHDMFHSTDQDAMNFALMAHHAPLNTAGPEAMDFQSGGYYFSHAIGPNKPWLGRHIRHALKGHPPTPATKAFYRFANHPIRLYSDVHLGLLRLGMRVASAIGRFYRKA